MPIKLLKFLTEIAMQFIFMFLELVPAIDFVKSPHLKVIVLVIFKMEIKDANSMKIRMK